MQEIYTNLYVGNDNDCNKSTDKDIAIIHACKSCHQKILDYKKSLPNTDKNYLIYQNNNNNLFLNLVDMKKEFSREYTDPIMKQSLDFIEENIHIKTVIIHCNQGMSRSPSIALLYLAKKNLISNNNYLNAKQDFLEKYKNYNPGRGIEEYLKNNWQTLITEL